MRLISADALHEALKTKQKWVVRCGDKHNEGYTYDQVHFAIDEAPTIDAVSEWIPCEERLPSVFQKAVVCNIHGEMMIGTYTEFGWVFPCYFEKHIAWMPLPEPYMKGADDEGVR